jgi:hypothetical protein
MSDIKEKFPKVPSVDTLEDDAIIELVDEIEEGAPADPISALEQQLLGISDRTGGQLAPASRLPDILDLSGIRFDEDDEARPDTPTATGAGLAGGETMSLQDAQRLLARAAEPGARQSTGGPSNEIEEISEFEEQFLDPEDILDSKPALQAAAKDDPPELLDLEEAELDNELLWFDDLAKGDAPAAGQPSDPTEQEEIELLLPEDADLGPTSAADVFAAHLDSMFAETGGSAVRAAEDGIAVPFAAGDAPPVAPPVSVIAAAADAMAPGAGIVIPTETPPGELPQPASIPPEEIEAAVERVIERKLGGTIEATILRAIETAVTREIERLKHLLLEDETP